MELVQEGIVYSKMFPNEEKYVLAQEIRRSLISIPSNIAEGESRRSEKEKIRFLDYALGSAFEAETQWHIAGRLNYITHLDYENYLNKM